MAAENKGHVKKGNKKGAGGIIIQPAKLIDQYLIPPASFIISENSALTPLTSIHNQWLNPVSVSFLSR